LAGFSTLLRPLLGVALLPRPPAGAGEASEVWAPRVRVLSLVDEGGALLGTVYVEPGGGYGTRMLRHGPWPWVPRAGGASDGSDSDGGGGGDGADTILSSRALWVAAEAQSGAGSTAAMAAAPAGGEVNTAWPPKLEPELCCWLQEAAAGAPAVAIGLSGLQPQPHLQPQAGGSGRDGCILSLPLLWELGHEMGHAVHLLMSSRPAGAWNAAGEAGAEAAAARVDQVTGGGGDGVSNDGSSGGSSRGGSSRGGSSGGIGSTPASPFLSGRFLPPDALELPSALFERLLLEPRALSAVCRGAGGAPLPAAAAGEAARHFRWRYGSPLAVQVRAGHHGNLAKGGAGRWVKAAFQQRAPAAACFPPLRQQPLDQFPRLPPAPGPRCRCTGRPAHGHVP
jgi:hypothetical protein